MTFGTTGLNISRFRQLAATLAIGAALAWGQAAAQDVADALFSQASALFRGAESTDAEAAQARGILDRILAEYPDSDLAAAIARGETVGGLDTGALMRRTERLSNAGKAPALALPVPPDQPGRLVLPLPSENTQGVPQLALPLPQAQPSIAEQLPLPGPQAVSAPPASDTGTEASEAALALDKQGLRDIQARLQVMGFDPNGIDGVAGRGTRAALRAWQASQGLAPTGFLSPGQYAFLRQQSEQALQAWLLNPDNKLLHTPPPPIAIGPGNMAGQWRYTLKCGRNSRMPGQTVTGVVSLTHASGNQYAGRIVNSQGLRGTVSGTLNGRTFRGNVNWGFLFGSSTVTGRIADQKLTMSGRDSLGCGFYAYKS